MNARNREFIGRLVGELDRFARDETDLEGMQATLQSVLALLERDESGVEQAVRLAEADVEEIRFTKLLDEQRPATVFRLDELRDQLARELELG
jgi:hypothetical protein